MGNKDKTDGRYHNSKEWLSNLAPTGTLRIGSSVSWEIFPSFLEMGSHVV